jgi:hypothetical protein
LHIILQNLCANLKSRLQDGFNGFRVNQRLKKVSQSDQTFFKEGDLKSLSRELRILEKWFDFDSSTFKHLSLKQNITFDGLTNIMEENRLNIDGNKLWNELTLFRSVADELIKKGILTDQKWVQFFSKASAPDLLKIVQAYIKDKKAKY